MPVIEQVINGDRYLLAMYRDMLPNGETVVDVEVLGLDIPGDMLDQGMEYAYHTHRLCECEGDGENMHSCGAHTGCQFLEGMGCHVMPSETYMMTERAFRANVASWDARQELFNRRKLPQLGQVT